jgi:hypothetical protein
MRTATCARRDIQVQRPSATRRLMSQCVRMTMTTTRSRQKSVVLKHPFRIERLLPARSADEESMEAFVLSGLYVATRIVVPAPAPRSLSSRW